jgi:hypothetical protein
MKDSPIMNNPTSPCAPHLVSAWRTAHGSTQAYPLETSATHLQDAVNDLAPRCNHKDTLAIFVRHARTGGILRLYSIKQESRASYVRNPVTGLTDSFNRLYPVEAAAIRMNAFEPARPFDALTDHPVLTDATLVDAQGRV